MRAETFLDTNVLIYAAAGRKDAPEKAARAWDLLEKADFGLSAQVLAEFYVNVIKKPAVPLAREEAETWIERLSVFPVVPVDTELVRSALRLSRRYLVSYWDAAIIAAAQRLGCATLYSEDLNHAQSYGDVKVVNPFASH
ncbi:MAG: PIN domain-containing protein [Salinarimonas sp.]|jgi:predicted nucleic acid-binding protein|nr:PIN domain-containing protein [Salinarimonas sp.]